MGWTMCGARTLDGGRCQVSGKHLVDGQWRCKWHRSGPRRASLPAEWPTGGAVYVIRHPASGRIKIGWTKKIGARLHNLAAGAGCELEVLLIVRAVKPDEAALHERFAHLRVYREWFEDDGSIAAWVAARRA